MMVVMPAAAVVIVVVMVMLMLFLLMMVVMPAAAIVIVVVMMMLVLFLLMMMVMSAAAIVIVVVMVMVMMFVLFLLMMMVMVSAGLSPVSVVHRDIRFIRLRDCFNRLFQSFRLLRLDAQLLGLKHHDSLLHLRQLANLRLNLTCTVCTAKIFHNIYFICHANSSCPYPTEYAVFEI